MGIPVPKPQKEEKKPYQGLKRTGFKKQEVKKKNRKKKGNSAKRNDYSASVRKRVQEEYNGICLHCKLYYGMIHKYDTIHHPYPRGHNGRGNFTNAYPVCAKMHEEIEKNITLREQIRAEYERKFGKYYHMDKQDIESLWRYGREVDLEALRLWEEFNRQKVDL